MHAPAASRQKTLGDKEFVSMMAILMALNALAIDTMLPAFPAMAAGLGVAGSNDIQYVITVYMLGMGMGSLLHGPLSDRFGRRPVLFAALAGYAAFALVCGRTQSFDLFIGMRFAHGLCGAGLGVVATAIVRDRFSGDAMAKRMSLIFLCFMVVPVIAPTIGQIILWFAGWREIYYLFAAAALAVMAWVHIRLPETLASENVVPMHFPTMLKGWRAVFTERTAGAYMLAGGVVHGAMLGFLSSSQQIFERVFNAADIFAYCFAFIAVGMAITNFTNARIVERIGARRVSQTANILFIVISLVQYVASILFPTSLPLFLVLMTANMALMGFMGSNFGSIAMQPFGAIAGTASSFQNFVRSVISVGIGGAIGLSLTSTVLPAIAGFFVCGLLSLLIIWWGERGKLFTRPGTTKHMPL